MSHNFLRAAFLAACFLAVWFLPGALLQTAEAATIRPTYVLIGDSIMSAVSPSVVGGSDGNVNQLAANIIQNERNIYIRNISSPGASLGRPGVTGFANIVPALETISGIFTYTSGYIIQAGTNDFGTNVQPGETANALRKIMAYARKTKRKVLLVDLTYRSDQNVKNKIGHTLDSYRWVRSVVCIVEYKDVCKAVVRDGTALGRASPNLYHPSEAAQNKLVHLNADGHRVWADWVMQKATEYGYF